MPEDGNHGQHEEIDDNIEHARSSITPPSGITTSQPMFPQLMLWLRLFLSARGIFPFDDAAVNVNLWKGNFQQNSKERAARKVKPVR